MKKTYLYLFFLLLCKISLCAKEVNISSPNGNYQMRVYDKGNRIYYSVSYLNQPIVLESLLGINGNGEWKDDIRVDKSVTASVDTLWKPVYGERNIIRDRYNSSEIDIVQANNPRRKLKLLVRASDEGVAFRYFFPGGDYLHITDEYTQYTMPKGAKAWFTKRAQSVYEFLPFQDWKGESERPLVIELPQGTYVLLTEAEVVNYVRTKFTVADAKTNTLAGTMYGAVDDIAPFKTPWRVIMAATQPGQLIEHNDLLLNLNEPNAIENPWWIRPGKVMREVTLTTEGAKSVVDYAVKHNLQYMLFDAGWYGPEGSKTSDATKVTIDPARNKNPNALNLQEVVAYAKKQNIGVILYVNQRALYQQLDELLPLYKSWGISGIKFGFVQVGSQFWTSWMHEAIRKCAQYGLMVDVHDEYRPTGFSRTYPNFMTQEGIYGNEEFPNATTNVTLPFTRFTQGPADYTICYYRQKWDKNTQADTGHGLVNARLIQTTSAHQLSMAVVYYSPLQHVYWYDKPSDSRNEPELEFFDRVPTVWDDTKVLHGEIGKYITIARRSGNDWFIGTMTNNESRKLNIPLDFLTEEKTYTAHIYYDDPQASTRTKVGIKTMQVTNKTILEADLLPTGGQAVWLEEKDEPAQFFVHPGVLHTKKNIEHIRQLVKDKIEPAYGSYQLLKAHKSSQADYKMEGPFHIISRDGAYKFTKSKMEADFSAAYQNALMWNITGNEAHAQKSLKILTAYADSLSMIPDTNDAPLLVGLEGLKIVYALEILKHTYPATTGQQIEKISQMFTDLFVPVMETFFARPPYTNGNWGPIICKTYMAAGIFLDNRKMYDKAVDFYLHARDNGTIIHYISGETGQIQESGRDQGHCMLGIAAMATLCEIAWQQGDNLYSALDNRLLKGFEYVAKYNLGNDVPFSTWTDITGKYGEWTNISDKGRGNFMPVFEMVYNHYFTRKGFAMPFTKQVLDKIRPEGFDRDQPAFGSLLFND
ncbi:MAG: alpha-glucosidase [Candidatus Ordinivivax streblomastigis]|uniref:Alpha-glucosidase n=1 Tax=Candidatus Ordinivivax streblomastigis TaxID=2540710 RepID=A0A5M8P2Y9_9BACT|nr:MAG: alpha-glucosidase [Candidatus Ordinivivax streblomastigis]